jgi:hypothetical protein
MFCEVKLETIYRDRHHRHKAQNPRYNITNNQIHSPIRNPHSRHIRITRNQTKHYRQDDRWCEPAIEWHHQVRLTLLVN